MNQRSDKKAAEKAKSDPIRDAYRDAAGGVCECGCRQEGVLEVHEIGAGSHRHQSVKSMVALWALLPECHKRWQGQPFPMQLEAKFREQVRRFNDDVIGRQAVGIVRLELADPSTHECDFCLDCRAPHWCFDLHEGRCGDCLEARGQNLDGDFH